MRSPSCFAPTNIDPAVNQRAPIMKQVGTVKALNARLIVVRTVFRFRNPQRAPKSVQVSSGGQELLAHAGRFCFPSSQSVSDASLCAVPLPTCFMSIFSPFLMTCTIAMA